MATEKSMEDMGLKRTMGVTAATAIGVGTMVGAGIFIFPGIAGGYAGPAAIISFLIGGLIAVIVASCTSELASAMPKSGGGYFFISRAFGPLWGTLIGIAQWIGLVFASAFYLMGFSDYFSQLLSNVGSNWTLPPLYFALLPVVALFAINIVGAKKVGRLQNVLVIFLTLILLLVFSYGLLQVLGVWGEKQLFQDFAPKGIGPIFPTTALVFTSYLGFVQIATIGGEIKNPKKNLPIALIASVVIVALLYVLVLLVSTSILSVTELERYGETAIVEVSKRILGTAGPLLVIGAGLLATLSSANASIISASRSVYALAKDNLITKKISRLNRRFGTPHFALLLAVLPVFGMLFLKNLELFAEVASFLHLVIYAGICLVLIHYRQKNYSWYQPGFILPLNKCLPIVGALGCMVLIFLMKAKSIIFGLVICVLVATYYWLFKKNAETVKEVQKDYDNPDDTKKEYAN